MIRQIGTAGLLLVLCACIEPPPPPAAQPSAPAAAAPAAIPAPSPTVLTMAGIGAVRIGMTVPEAEQALQVGLEPMLPQESAACWTTRRADGRDPNVFYMVENGRITRIDIGDAADAGANAAAITSDKGIAIGAAEAEVIAAYGPATEVLPHKYDDTGHYLVVQSADKAAALVFETAKGIVTTFRAGLHPAVDYVEGCS